MKTVVCAFFSEKCTRLYSEEYSQCERIDFEVFTVGKGSENNIGMGEGVGNEICVIFNPHSALEKDVYLLSVIPNA